MRAGRNTFQEGLRISQNRADRSAWLAVGYSSLPVIPANAGIQVGASPWTQLATAGG